MKQKNRRRCMVCNTKFTPGQYKQILCGSFECRMEYLRLRSNGFWEKYRERKETEQGFGGLDFGFAQSTKEVL